VRFSVWPICHSFFTVATHAIRNRRPGPQSPQPEAFPRNGPQVHPGASPEVRSPSAFQAVLPCPGLPGSGRSRFSVRIHSCGFQLRRLTGPRRCASQREPLRPASHPVPGVTGLALQVHRGAGHAGHSSPVSTRPMFQTCRGRGHGPAAGNAPAATLMGFCPSQCCSCPQVAARLRTAQPTCRFLSVRLELFSSRGRPLSAVA
jgi:hypothetical protein